MGGFHDAVILRGGLQVFPRLIASEHHTPFKAGVASSGVPELDALVGGGIDRGTSCLLLGPAGTGKSTIALQFAVAAASRGESVCTYLFEENIRTLKGRAKTVGLTVENYMKRGLLTFHEVDPGKMAPGEFVNQVRGVVEAGTRLIVLDSLNGYLQAMPSVRYLEIQLHELFAYLANRGVVTILTLAQHGLLSQVSTPLDLTYLADSVILLRYFEESGRIRKAMSVVKKRMGAHEDTIREFKFSPRGMQVGAPLDEFDGVLTGVPKFRGSPERMLKPR